MSRRVSVWKQSLNHAIPEHSGFPKIQCKASLIIIAEKIIEREALSEQTKKPPSDLIINRALKKKVSLILNLP